MGRKITVAVASDKSGFPLKQAVVEYLRGRDDIEVLDYGLASLEENEPYHVQAAKVARAIQAGTAERGVLICGTGQGVGIVANKFKGIYAVVADTIFAAERGRIINDANVVTMGGWITAPRLGVEIVRSWLATGFTETMEDRAEWLKAAFGKVQEIEAENFRDE
ncbi:RpiB/LacA/LacB family sugar-phosphate isomerase [Spirochaeta africana]|uniref:Sugar-phosphate isomerase, RpiB/LacA/LacB family n=1 Tax=Spirochaeta africana (strain ATCC 700263 / DSM 8902 / Z-7692) TaxID=889378 RepID=H9UFE4_SPIAZ|nr:RpiB/LacA/LacB family sugar-phosphate isomerase [Spirochaeta africana]AFG36237.1 sugar-phosphate isomerase, RpiB/LacA/LacB family [Spirochaeta africana DSM 8902]